MSLLRLLTAGTSLVGLKKAETRYHLPGNKALPKFGSKKNPFRATVLPEQGEAEREPEKVTPLDASVPAIEEKSEDSRPAGAEPEKGRKEAPIKAKDDNPDCGRQAASAERSERRPSAVKAFLLWGRAKAKRPGMPGGRPMVQGELSLDRVKVVRNDLSESDVEIIRRAGQPGTPSRSAEQAATGAKGATPDLGWGAAAGRLLGIGKV